MLCQHFIQLSLATWYAPVTEETQCIGMKQNSNNKINVIIHLETSSVCVPVRMFIIY